MVEGGVQGQDRGDVDALRAVWFLHHDRVSDASGRMDAGRRSVQCPR